MLYTLSRSLLFKLDPERAHELALGAIASCGAVPPLRSSLAAIYGSPKVEPVSVFGLTYPNRVGLAAGYDKDGEGWRGLSALGFGHIEIGTVTPRPQSGNPKPRVFRLVEDRALINRMGFPGRGADYVAARMQRVKPEGLILGANLGKQKETPLEEAAGDYEALMDRFAPLADYLAINISSPNTPGLRRLQEKAFLGDLLGSICERRKVLTEKLKKRVPVLIKIAPDLEPQQLEVALSVMLETGIDGVIATNTTLSRDGVTSSMASEEGGLSGALLTERATEMVRNIKQQVGDQLPIVAVGGIMSIDDARAKIEAGASLVQVYTGLIYAGPAFVKRLVQAIG
jgi:dihydroorotate dehydrogenase